MPDIKGKKIIELLDGSAVADPLFVIGGQDGKAWSIGINTLTSLVKQGKVNLDILPSLDFNEVIEPGVYKIDLVNFYMDGYAHSPRVAGVIPSNDPILFVQLDGTYIHQTIIFDHAQIERTRSVYPDYGDYSSSGVPDLNIWEIWHITKGYVSLYMPFQTGSIQSGKGASMCTSLNDVKMPGRYLIRSATYQNNGYDSYPINISTLSAYGFPVYPSRSSLGYFVMDIDFAYLNDYGDQSHNGVIQRILYNRKELAGDTTIYFHIRQFSDLTKAYTKWLNTVPTLANNASNAVGQADNKLPAGTATLAPLQFTPGVQAQNPIVKNALNYDGSNFYYFDNTGQKKILNATNA